MVKIKKKFIVDEQGNPKEVILLLEDFQKIEELLGLDLDDEAINDLRKARSDRETGNKNGYVDLDTI
jgi:regulator of PEP synthase PpsR (kinase-PPPase family)